MSWTSFQANSNSRGLSHGHLAHYVHCVQEVPWNKCTCWERSQQAQSTWPCWKTCVGMTSCFVSSKSFNDNTKSTGTRASIADAFLSQSSQQQPIALTYDSINLSTDKILTQVSLFLTTAASEHFSQGMCMRFKIKFSVYLLTWLGLVVCLFHDSARNYWVRLWKNAKFADS